MKHNRLASCAILLTWLIALPFCQTKIIEDCDIKAKFTFSLQNASTVIFQNESEKGNGITYLWAFGDGASSEDVNPTHNYATSGEKIVTLTVKQADCNHVMTDTISIKKDDPIANFETDKTQYSINELVKFTNTSINGETYEWNFGDPTRTDDVSTANNPSWTYSDAGEFSVMLTAKRTGFPSNTVTKTVIVKEPSVNKSYVLASAGSNQRILGIDVSASGDFFAMVSDDAALFFTQLDATGLLKTPTPFKVVGSSASATLLVNNFKKTSAGYGVACENGISTGVIGFGLYADLGGFSFQGKKDLHKSSNSGNTFLNDLCIMDSGKWLFCGTTNSQAGADSSGMYFVHTSALNAVSNKSSKYLFHDQKGASAKAIAKIASGYLVSGMAKKSAAAAFENCFFKLDANLNIVGSVNFFGQPNFFVRDILALDGNKYALIGNESGSGKIRVLGESGNLVWEQPYTGFLLNEVIFTADKRMIGVGKIKDGGNDKAAWIEINPSDGARVGELQSYQYIDGAGSSEAFCVAQKKNGGFVIGGKIVVTGNTNRNLIISTDKNGKIQ